VRTDAGSATAAATAEAVRHPDLGSLAAGFAIALLGVLLLLQQEGTIDLEPGWLGAALTACAGAALVASGLGARED
jgi:hypothetical protein